MLTIRFARIGKRRQPFFRIIISEKGRDTKGTYLELLGHYDPRTKNATLKNDRIQHWLSKGAQTSASVFNLLLKHKLVDGDKRRSVFVTTKRKASIEETKAKEVAANEAAQAAAKAKEAEAAVASTEEAEAKPEEKTEEASA